MNKSILCHACSYAWNIGMGRRLRIDLDAIVRTASCVRWCCQLHTDPSIDLLALHPIKTSIDGSRLCLSAGPKDWID